MNYKDYYTALGKLVYAIALADGSIQTEETAKIFHFVISQIVDLEKESGNGISALEAFNTEREFHRLIKENASIAEAQKAFITFLEENKAQLDDKMKSTCIAIMERVAGADNKIEESERLLIEKIKRKIHSI